MSVSQPSIPFRWFLSNNSFPFRTQHPLRLPSSDEVVYPFQKTPSLFMLSVDSSLTMWAKGFWLFCRRPGNSLSLPLNFGARFNPFHLRNDARFVMNFFTSVGMAFFKFLFSGGNTGPLTSSILLHIHISPPLRLDFFFFLLPHLRGSHLLSALYERSQDLNSHLPSGSGQRLFL